MKDDYGGRDYGILSMGIVNFLGSSIIATAVASHGPCTHTDFDKEKIVT